MGQAMGGGPEKFYNCGLAQDLVGRMFSSLAQAGGHLRRSRFGAGDWRARHWATSGADCFPLFTRKAPPESMGNSHCLFLGWRGYDLYCMAAALGCTHPALSGSPRNGFELSSPWTRAVQWTPI